MLFFPYFFCFSAACYKIQSCYSRLHHLLSMSLFSAPLQARHPSFLYSPFSLYHFPAAIYSRTLLFQRLFIFILRHTHTTAQTCHSCLFFLYPFSRRLLQSHHSVTPAYIFYFLYNLSHFSLSYSTLFLIHTFFYKLYLLHPCKLNNLLLSVYQFSFYISQPAFLANAAPLFLYLLFSPLHPAA